MLSRAIIALGFAVVSGGIAPAGVAARDAIEAPATTRADKAAALLVAADRGAQDGSLEGRRLLAASLAALERLGVHAQPDSEDGALGDWRRIAGSEGAVPDRGRILGPAYRRGWIDPGQQLRVEQLFLSGQTATVALAATPDQPVRLAVTGPNAPVACPDDARNCKWLPLFTQRYAITIANTGTQRARFYLVVD